MAPKTHMAPPCCDAASTRGLGHGGDGRHHKQRAGPYSHPSGCVRVLRRDAARLGRRHKTRPPLCLHSRSERWPDGPRSTQARAHPHALVRTAPPAPATQSAPRPHAPSVALPQRVHPSSSAWLISYMAQLACRTAECASVCLAPTQCTTLGARAHRAACAHEGVAVGDGRAADGHRDDAFKGHLNGDGPTILRHGVHAAWPDARRALGGAQRAQHGRSRGAFQLMCDAPLDGSMPGVGRRTRR